MKLIGEMGKPYETRAWGYCGKGQYVLFVSTENSVAHTDFSFFFAMRKFTRRSASALRVLGKDPATAGNLN